MIAKASKTLMILVSKVVNDLIFAKVITKFLDEFSIARGMAILIKPVQIIWNNPAVRHSGDHEVAHSDIERFAVASLASVAELAMVGEFVNGRGKNCADIAA